VVLEKIASLLRPRGTIIVIEPARDWFSIRDAAIAALIRILLSLEGRWHEQLNAPESTEQLDQIVHAIHREYVEARDVGEPPQSPSDNSSYASAILEELGLIFDPIALERGFAFLPRIVGGVRAPSERLTLETARFLEVFDTYCVSNGILEPGAFSYAGQLKSSVNGGE
jgi:hypothetical protein